MPRLRLHKKEVSSSTFFAKEGQEETNSKGRKENRSGDTTRQQGGIARDSCNQEKVNRFLGGKLKKRVKEVKGINWAQKKNH